MVSLRPQLVRRDERPLAPGPHTPGEVREQAFAGEDRWVGLVRTEPGVSSGWHHHGDTDTYIYVVKGSIELEFGPNLRERFTGKAGDFAVVPRGLVHREGTTPYEPAEAVVIRLGRGQPVFDVEGPERG